MPTYAAAVSYRRQEQVQESHEEGASLYRRVGIWQLGCCCAPKDTFVGFVSRALVQGESAEIFISRGGGASFLFEWSGDKQPASHQEVMDEVKARGWLSSPCRVLVGCVSNDAIRCRNPSQDMLDEACEVIDEVTVQGVLHRNTAAKRKDSAAAKSKLLVHASWLVCVS